LKKWAPLAALALAQFIMVLDQAVMNVSISQLVEDFDTSVTTIQGVITLYTLVMAMFMLIGAKIGDIGWSVLEGLGAALVLPALAALIAGNFEGRERITAYAIIGGVAGRSGRSSVAGPRPC